MVLVTLSNKYFADMTADEIAEGNVYRVSFSNDENDKESVFISCLGIECLDTSVKSHYINIRETPKWVQEGVARLMIVDNIKGVGERHSSKRNIFYLFHD
tara:strand:+ start:1633 stop:1932 length:300 start_codon:yes stop_codon:yes gene_type:complete